MATEKKHQRIWLNTPSGITVPGGTTSELNQSSSLTYLRIKEKALAIEQLLAQNGISMPKSCDLAQLIEDAKTLSDSWLTNRGTSTTILFRAGLLDRIAEAVLPLADICQRQQYLTALISGSLDLLKRERSRAKDILWELELWSVLRKRSLEANLCEPPDIVVTFEHAKIGIACKKLYSERNVQKVLSQAVSQIETTFDFGIVAINIDDLVPPEKILQSPTQEAMGRVIDNLNTQFLHRHERHFRKYLASGRLLSALISTSVLADVYGQRTRFNTARQVTVWTIPGLAPEKAKQLKRFYDQIMQ